MRRTLALALAAAGSFAFAGAGVAPAGAQTAIGCADDQPIEARLAAAPTAFTAVVHDLRDQGRDAYVDVIRVWRGGPIPKHVLVRGSVGEQAKVSTALDRSYNEGAVYLFLPTHGASPRFAEDACSGTRPLTATLSAMAPAGGGDAPVAGGITAPGASKAKYLPLAIGGAALIALAVGFVLARSRRPLPARGG